jgi:antitoxin component YwqK of YwqJK toxin-antitoxin module
MKKLLLHILLSLGFIGSGVAGSQLDFTLSDFCYQQPNVQDRGGVYYFPNEEVGITASSLCVYKDLYGQYMSKVELVNGKFDGKFIRWWENGQKHQEKNYKDGILDGKSSAWWSGGTIYNEGNYKDGKRDGKQTDWYENGQIKFEVNYIEDITDGRVAFWTENGQIRVDENFKDGKLDGKQTEWFENGQIESELNYKDGKLDGKWTKWRSDGLKWKEAVFKNGKIVGNCEYLNQPLPIDTGLPEGFSVGDECPPKDQQEKKELAEKQAKIAQQLTEVELELKNQLEAEIAAQQQAFEREQYTQLLNQEIQEELSLELMNKIENQKAILQSAWIGNIAAEVKSVWNYSGAEDGWFVEVLVTQNKEGKVLNVKFRDNNIGNSVIAKRFIESVERAVYKSSPLPIAPDASVWDKDIMFRFSP